MYNNCKNLRIRCILVAVKPNDFEARTLENNNVVTNLGISNRGNDSIIFVWRFPNIYDFSPGTWIWRALFTTMSIVTLPLTILLLLTVYSTNFDAQESMIDGFKRIDIRTRIGCRDMRINERYNFVISLGSKVYLPIIMSSESFKFPKTVW